MLTSEKLELSLAFQLPRLLEHLIKIMKIVVDKLTNNFITKHTWKLPVQIQSKLLATEQLHRSSWGFRALLKSTSGVVMKAGQVLVFHFRSLTVVFNLLGI